MTVYIDLVFFENLALNYIIILSTCILRKTKIHWIKFFFASVIRKYWNYFKLYF